MVCDDSRWGTAGGSQAANAPAVCSLDPGFPRRAGVPGIQVKGWLFPMSFFDRVDAVGMEGEVIFDGRHRGVGGLIGPHGVRRAISAEWNAEVGAVPLIGTVGGMFRAIEKRHVYVLAGHVVNRRVGSLAEDESIPRVGHDTTCDRDDNSVGIVLDGDRMIRPWNLDGLWRRQELL
jgi:hypothetical protein